MPFPYLFQSASSFFEHGHPPAGTKSGKDKEGTFEDSLNLMFTKEPKQRRHSLQPFEKLLILAGR